MRILKNRAFTKAATTEGLTDEQLKGAIKEMQDGLVGDALGGSLYKKRVAENNKGKSGGFRTIILFKDKAEYAFCLYVFPKNKKANVSSL